MLVSNFRDFLNINNVAVRVAQRLDKNRLSVLTDGRFKAALDIRINKGSGDAGSQGESVLQQVEGAD